MGVDGIPVRRCRVLGAGRPPGQQGECNQKGLYQKGGNRWLALNHIRHLSNPPEPVHLDESPHARAAQGIGASASLGDRQGHLPGGFRDMTKGVIQPW
jgi:hypothetical protein